MFYVLNVCKNLFINYNTIALILSIYSLLKILNYREIKIYTIVSYTTHVQNRNIKP